MRRKKLFALYVTAVLIACVLPNPESFIVRAVERAGLVLILVRGLKGHYDDFVDAFGAPDSGRASSKVRGKLNVFARARLGGSPAKRPDSLAK